MKNIFKFIAAGVILFGAVSCEDFLNRPAEDRFTTSDFYKTDAQLQQGVDYLYSSPWYDCIRLYIYGSETMCGNVYQSGTAYATLTVNGTDDDLKNFSYSLWAVNAQCNTVINNILASEGPSQAAKDQYIGEALAWKAMAYFLLVRTFGDVPIIHDNTEIIKDASYNEVKKVQKADVYEYICMTLEKAMELLPKNAYIGKYNRIDYYAAEGLLAKVYLAKAGVSGELNQDDLSAAVKYAKDVAENSGRSLTPKYSDVFRLSPTLFQQTGECLFSWLWTATSGIWTCQNSIQCDVGLAGMDEFADLWGDWKGPSVDLMDEFGISALTNPMSRIDNDDRRKATIMMFGDKYEYLWQDHGGLDMYQFYYNPDYATGTNGAWCCPTGANYAKHLYGNNNDHVLALGVEASRMCNQLPTHILRLSDVYLVLAEAAFLTGDSATALEYVNKVRGRANASLYEDIDFEKIWKERRLELALEGDRWFDYVRRSYYDMDACCAELLAQRRSGWSGDLLTAFKNFVIGDDGNYAGPGAHSWDVSAVVYLSQGMEGCADLTNVTPEMFTLPFPTEDAVLNPGVGSGAEAIHVDVREEYKYNY
ncbi:MAG: RagB/SusD family nutrient uptake outer membrane protein [Candidatus Cryptobacteroides sp.]